ncbi:MAG: hypothetical protein NVS2B12_04560 [Ktedonobacteraceae bacterium]
MEITGSNTIKASQTQTYQALLNPEVLKESILGCSSAEYVETPWEGGRQIKLLISPNFPGLTGTYTIFVKPEDLVEPSHLVLVSTPNSSVGSIDARCVVDLISEGEQTTINYTTHATLTGKLALTPEFVIKTSLKGVLDHFFKNLEKRVR